MDRYQVVVTGMLGLPVVLSVMMVLMLTFRPWCVSTMVTGIQTCHMLVQVILHRLSLIDVRKYRSGNQKGTIQRNWQLRVHKAKKNKTKTQQNICWTPLYASKHKWRKWDIFIIIKRQNFRMLIYNILKTKILRKWEYYYLFLSVNYFCNFRCDLVWTLSRECL